MRSISVKQLTSRLKFEVVDGLSVSKADWKPEGESQSRLLKWWMILSFGAIIPLLPVCSSHVVFKSDFPRFVFNKRSVGSTHSSHGNLSQASITSGDVLSGDEVDSPLHRPAKIGEQRSNSSTDIPGAVTRFLLCTHGMIKANQRFLHVSRLQTLKEIPLMPALGKKVTHTVTF